MNASFLAQYAWALQLWFGSMVVLGLCLALVVLVDTSRDTPLARFTRLLARIPRWAARTVPGGRRAHVAMVRCGAFLLTQPHALVQVFYLVLVGSGYAVFVLQALPLLPVDSPHRFLTVGVALATFGLFFAASARDPGTITAANYRRHGATYPFDGVCFFTERVCSTCRHPQGKPARSKHCRVCNRCVARFDHHCYWTNNCIGAHNYGLFLAWLGCQVVFCAYGGWLLLRCFALIAEREGLWAASFSRAPAGSGSGAEPAGYWVLARYFLHERPLLWAATATALALAPPLALFWAHHLSQALRNTTTNEASKRDAALAGVGGAESEEARALAAASAAAAPAARVTRVELATSPGGVPSRRIPWRDVDASARRRLVAANVYDRGWRANFAEAVWPLRAGSASSRGALAALRRADAGLGLTHAVARARDATAIDATAGPGDADADAAVAAGGAPTKQRIM